MKTLIHAALILSSALTWLAAHSVRADERASQGANEQAAEETADRDTIGQNGALMPVERAIKKFAARTEFHPKDYLSRVVLGRLYLRKARESDDLPSYRLAERTLRQALQIQKDHLPAKLYLAQALQARHQFREALELADQVARKHPRDPLALAIRGDALLELGRYDEAAAAFTELSRQRGSPSVLVRLARIDELQGRTNEAIVKIRKARGQAATSGLPDRSVAWYEWRLGHALLHAGQVDEAADHFEQAAKLSPGLAPAAVGLAAVDVARGRLESAVDRFRRAVRQFGEPPMMAALGDVLTRLGSNDEAESWYAKAEAVMVEEATVAAAAHYREVSLFFSDRDRDPKQGLKAARRDYEIRQDIYAADTLAWALHKSGKNREALPVMQRALRLGTQDASLHFHAGMIHAALGDQAAARRSLTRALEINPHFSILHAEVAARTLADLKSKPAQ